VRIDDKWYTHIHIEHQKRSVWIDERDDLDENDEIQIDLRERLDLLDEKLCIKFDSHHISQTSILWTTRQMKRSKYHEKILQRFRDHHRFERKQLCVIQRRTTQAHQHLERLQFKKQREINIWRIRIRWLDFQIERHTIFLRSRSIRMTQSLMCKLKISQQTFHDTRSQRTQLHTIHWKILLIDLEIDTIWQTDEAPSSQNWIESIVCNFLEQIWILDW
jgi:hypothetical protein